MKKIIFISCFLCTVLFVFDAIAQNNKSDKVPNSFAFIDQFDVNTNTDILSDPVTINGIDDSVSVRILGGYYSINNGEFTKEQQSIVNNDEVRVKLKSSPSYGEVTSLIFYVEDKPYVFNTRTIEPPDSGWARLPEIVSAITRPSFQDKDFNVIDYGAKNDGVTICTDAFKAAIEDCHNAGGGKVIVPSGTFLTGPIHLLSNTNLYLSEGAYVKFSTVFSDYLPVVYTRFEGTELYNYSPCVYAFEQENIGITGPGTLDAQGAYGNWWDWKSTGSSDVSTLRTLAENSVAVEDRIFGAGHYIRPNMIQPYRCKNVLIDSVTVLNGTMWHIHPVLSTNVTVSNVTVVGHGPNNDGCNPESCTNVLIKNCYFDTGDDCIAIKAGRNADGRRVNVPTSYVVVQGCEMKDGHGGVVIGSEITGGAHHIYAEDCHMDSPNLDRVLRIKSNSIRGGVVENIYMRNIEVGEVSNAVVRVNFDYGEGDVSTYVPVVRNIEVRDLTCDKADYAVQFIAYKRSPVENIRLINCSFASIKTPFSANYYTNLCLDSVVVNGASYHTIMQPDGAIDSTLSSSGVDNLYVDEGEFDVFPNPIVQQAEVEFSLKVRALVNIELFTLTGEKMGTKFSGYLKEGRQNMTLDFGENFHGVYLLLVQIGNNSRIKQVVVN